MKPLVIGVGNRFRGDDAAGLEVASALAKRLKDKVDTVIWEGNPLDLLEIWRGRSTVYVIDTVSSGEYEAGFLYRFLPNDEEIPAIFLNFSTHLFGVVQVIEMAKTLGQLPTHFVLYGIEADRFSFKDHISKKLKDQLKTITATIEKDIHA